ncbi:transposase [Streptomyces sp. NPDC055749]
MRSTDAQRARIEPLPPDREPRQGGRWLDHREVIDAIAWRFLAGAQWVVQLPTSPAGAPLEAALFPSGPGL